MPLSIGGTFVAPTRVYCAGVSRPSVPRATLSRAPQSSFAHLLKETAIPLLGLPTKNAGYFLIRLTSVCDAHSPCARGFNNSHGPVSPEGA